MEKEKSRSGRVAAAAPSVTGALGHRGVAESLGQSPTPVMKSRAVLSCSM